MVGEIVNQLDQKEKEEIEKNIGKMMHDRTIRTIEILSVFKLMNHKAKRILDFGCGNGQITKTLDNKGYDITGLDKIKKNHEIARKMYPECDFRLYEGKYPPFGPKSFDTIIINDVMEHIQYNPMEDLLERLKYILKPNGIIYISVLNRFSIIESHTQIPFITWFPRIFWEPIEKIFRRKQHYNISDIFPYTRKRLRLLCIEHNFQFKDFTFVYIFHKFIKSKYITNKLLRGVVVFLKRVKLLNLFFHLACRCSEIICVLKPKKKEVNEYNEKISKITKRT